MIVWLAVVDPFAAGGAAVGLGAALAARRRWRRRAIALGGLSADAEGLRRDRDGELLRAEWGVLLPGATFIALAAPDGPAGAIVTVASAGRENHRRLRVWLRLRGFQRQQ
ncbi:MAG: hypothetical protein JNM90_12560 [Burkholderiales bacterium]|nr:hypothetical protein [Burkholderiales bacterium]